MAATGIGSVLERTIFPPITAIDALCRTDRVDLPLSIAYTVIYISVFLLPLFFESLMILAGFSRDFHQHAPPFHLKRQPRPPDQFLPPSVLCQCP